MESQRVGHNLVMKPRFYFWLHWVFAAVCGLSLVVASRELLFLVALGHLTAVASLVVEHRLWGSRASVVVTRGL